MRELSAHQGGPFHAGEFSWWLLGDLAPLLGWAIIEAGGTLWTPIEQQRTLHELRDAAGNLCTLVATVDEGSAYKPRWFEGPGCLTDSRCDTKYEFPPTCAWCGTVYGVFAGEIVRRDGGPSDTWVCDRPIHALTQGRESR